ncbi:MAG: PaaI family thioesterase [Planctomycetia bacterium]|nr:MAG: PaaI family thioesterase [Planctomycetia bacterium]
MDAALAAEILRRAAEAPCIESGGMRVLELKPGLVRLTARHNPEFNGLLSGFHGGMLAFVADCAAWFAIVSHTGPDEPLLTTDMHVRYLGACAGDVRVEARVIKLGRTLCPVSVEMFDPEGRLAAVGQVTYIRTNNLRRDA